MLESFLFTLSCLCVCLCGVLTMLGFCHRLSLSSPSKWDDEKSADGLPQTCHSYLLICLFWFLHLFVGWVLCEILAWPKYSFTCIQSEIRQRGLTNQIKHHLMPLKAALEVGSLSASSAARSNPTHGAAEHFYLEFKVQWHLCFPRSESRQTLSSAEAPFANLLSS